MRHDHGFAFGEALSDFRAGGENELGLAGQSPLERHDRVVIHPFQCAEIVTGIENQCALLERAGQRFGGGKR